MVKKEEMGTILGVDLGFVQTKAVGDNWKTKFRSIVKPRSEVVVSGLADAEGFLVEYKDEVYNVGSKGSYDFNADRLTQSTDMAKLLSVFGQYQHDTSVAVIEMLVTGLPVYEFNIYKDTLRDNIQTMFQYKFNGTKRLLNVQEAIVIPQSAGAFYDYILDEEGEPNDNPLAKENVLSLDIGGRTSDGCIMEASRYSQDSFTIFKGVWKAQNELRKYVMKEFRYALQPYEVDVVMRTNTLMLNNESHNVKELVYKAVASAYPEMRDELSLYIDDYRRFATILLAGGGAYVFHDFLDEDIRTPIIVMEEAEYANASGNRKYGKLLSKNR